MLDSCRGYINVFVFGLFGGVLFHAWWWANVRYDMSSFVNFAFDLEDSNPTGIDS